MVDGMMAAMVRKLELSTPLAVFVASLVAACGGDDAVGPANETQATSTSSVDSSTGVGGHGGGGGSGGTTGGSGGAPDPCFDAMPVCPTPPANYGEGDGLKAIDRCAFPIDTQGTDDAAIAEALATKLPVRSIADILQDLNRTATAITAGQVPGAVASFHAGFRWNDGDNGVSYWYPQGITGSHDASPDSLVAGKKMILTSWYYKHEADPASPFEKGVRIAFVDVTKPASIKYRFVLLVNPSGDAQNPNFGPVSVHAGGITWYENRLYVVDTSGGFRVFDMDRIMEVASDVDAMGYDAATGKYRAHGYKYVLPQIAMLKQASTCAPLFSYVSLDRSTDPPSLVSGEFRDTSVYGRIFRWNVGIGTSAQDTRSFATEAFYAAQSKVQGAASYNGVFWLSCNKPTASGGFLYRTALETPSVTYGWINGPESLSYDPNTDELWSQSEVPGARLVLSVLRADVSN